MGDDPTKILKPSVFGRPVEGAAEAELDRGMGTSPEGAVANNVARAARGGETQSNQLRDLQAQITA